MSINNVQLENSDTSAGCVVGSDAERRIRDAMASLLSGYVAVGTDGEWISIRRHVRSSFLAHMTPLLAELDTLRRERDIAREAMEGMRANDRRYRWLRDSNNDETKRASGEYVEPMQVSMIWFGRPKKKWFTDDFAFAPIGKKFDAAIDAAIDASAKEQQT